VDRCRRTTFDRQVIREHAQRFSRERFRQEFQAAVADALGSAGVSA